MAVRVARGTECTEFARIEKRSPAIQEMTFLTEVAPPREREIDWAVPFPRLNVAPSPPSPIKNQPNILFNLKNLAGLAER
jgi:hypothetical protein